MKDGVTSYDTSVKTVKVKVEDAGDGTLTAQDDKESHYTGSSATTTAEGSAVLDAKKAANMNLLGREDLPFQLLDADGEVIENQCSSKAG